MVGSDWLLALHSWELKQSLDLGHSLATFFCLLLTKQKNKTKRKKTKTNTKKKREGKKGVWPREVHLAKRKLFQPPFFAFELWDIGNDCILGEEMVVITLHLTI